MNGNVELAIDKGDTESIAYSSSTPTRTVKLREKKNKKNITIVDSNTS